MLAALLAAALVFSPADAEAAYCAASNLVSRCPVRDAGSVGGRSAADLIENMLLAKGVEVRRDDFVASCPTGVCHFVNLEVRFGAKRPEGWTVFLSHYDTKPGKGCPGANDGAATSGLLIALADALRRAGADAPKVMLIWTDGEESAVKYGRDDGLQGSRRAAQQLKDSREKVSAVICLDMLGDRDLNIEIAANSTASVVERVFMSAASIGISDRLHRSHRSIIDDHQPFIELGLPAADLIDFNYGPSNSWWHTPEDTMDKVSSASLLTVGRLAIDLSLR